MILNKNQITGINLLWDSYKESIELNSLITESLVYKYRDLELCDLLVLDKDSLIEVKDKRIKLRDDLIIEYKDNEKITNRKIRWLKTKSSIFGVSTVAALAYITYGLFKDN